MTVETLFPDPVAPHLASGFSFVHQDKPTTFDARTLDIDTESRLASAITPLLGTDIFRRYEATMIVTPQQYTRALYFNRADGNAGTWHHGEYRVKLKIRP